MNNQRIESMLSSHRVVAVIGGQWGDEGKGKIIDLFSSWADIVARGTGGANAGHTIKANGQEHIFHLLPSGILHDADGTITVCGSGMVIDPAVLIREMSILDDAGLSYGNFRLAHNATLVLPIHIALDKLRELQAGSNKIGTTGRGITPAYVGKVARRGLSVNDLLNPDILVEKLERIVDETNISLQSFDQENVQSVLLSLFPDIDPAMVCGGFNAEVIAERYLAYGRTLEPYINCTDDLMRAYLSDGRKNILLEGAQGFLLSIKHGTYPYVTSSDCSIAGLAEGVGLKESDVDQCYLVVKAPYMTRVGAGPFPTELGGETSATSCNDPDTTRDTELKQFPTADVNSSDKMCQGVGIRIAGDEYGATTKRPRRTGWLDLPLLRHALRTTGSSEIVLTKLDVLDECETIRICTSYMYNGPGYRSGNRTLKTGDRLDMPVMEATVLGDCEPFYEHFAGWLTPTSGISEMSELPENLVSIIRFIERATGPYGCERVAIASVGPDRDQTIICD